MFGIVCEGIGGGVSIIHLENYLSGYMPPSRTWYPNVTLFTLFEELEELTLNMMQIGGGLQRTMICYNRMIDFDSL